MDEFRKFFLMQQTYGTLFSLTNKLQVQGDKHLQSLTSRQFMTMVAIMHLPKDQTTLNNISRKLGITKQSVKQIIAIIENKGYVQTLPSPHDRRAVNVRITEAGKGVLQDCNEKGMRFLTNLFQEFKAEELEILWALLKKLYRFDGEEQDGFEAEASLESL